MECAIRRSPRDTPAPAFWYVLVEAQGCGVGSCPSETADHKRSRNEFAPVLQSLVSDAQGTIIIVATDTGDSDP
jgi:hypothetical protein